MKSCPSSWVVVARRGNGEWTACVCQLNCRPEHGCSRQALISLLLGSHREQEQHEDHQQQHYSYDSEW
jgi:hypothetical protein